MDRPNTANGRVGIELKFGLNESHIDRFNIGRNRLAAIRGVIITNVLRTNVLLAFLSVWVSLKTLNALNADSSSRIAVTIKASRKK